MRIAKRIAAIAGAASFGVGAATAHEVKNGWEAMTLEELREAHEVQPRAWQRILNRGDMVAGIYRLPVGAEDQQPVHDDDEIYHVLSGKGVLVVGEERIPASAGSILYVARDIPHRFVDITEPLEVLVIFAKHREE